MVNELKDLVMEQILSFLYIKTVLLIEVHLFYPVQWKQKYPSAVNTEQGSTLYQF